MSSSLDVAGRVGKKGPSGSFQMYRISRLGCPKFGYLSYPAGPTSVGMHQEYLVRIKYLGTYAILLG